MKKNATLFILLLVAATLKAGTIITNLTSLPNFGNVYPFHSSTSLRYTLSASSLTADLILTASTNYEISLVYGYGYSSSITLTPTAGNVGTTTVYVRFSPSTIGSSPGTISNSSSGSTAQNISLNGTCIAWAIPSAYYSTVTTQRGASLKTVLYNKILGHTVASYTPGVWTAYQTTDVQPNGKVWDVYSTRFDQASPYEYTMTTNQCGSYSVEGNCYNREHSFPKSWFNDASPMYTELFHILASDGKVNGMRNNYPYGNVSTATYTSLYGGKLGTGPNNYGYTGIVFEPIDEYKGDLARGYFYMATRYENIIAGWTVNTGASDVLNGTSFPCFNPWQLSLLQEWNNLDPVSDKEMKRNNAIYAIQNNRNPFIDSPHFVQRIWGGSIPAEPTIAASNLTITNNSTTSVTLNWKSGNGNRRIVLARIGSPINSLPVDTFQYAANSIFTSAPQIGTGNYVVYNGTGSSVTLTNLIQNTNYYYAVIEYNGWYTTSNYQTTGYLTTNAFTLPVELSSFKASRLDDKILLNWVTASESNNHLFTVERSYDSKQWENIGSVTGAGTTSKISSYQLLDPTPTSGNFSFSGPIYYRLKQTDFDGTHNYSKTITVDWSDIVETKISVSPNPFSDNLRISVNSSKTTPVTLHIQNLMGEYYVTKQMQLEEGTNEITIDDTGFMPSGVYILHLEQQQRSQYFKIVKK